MFGLKWLWKTNRGSNIDTSNFVSKEFLNTTLQDYVNRDLLNTTLSNELANYVSTTTLNNTLNNYVLNSSLNTTLSSYVQTNTLNTTLSNYVQTNTLNTTLSNYVQTSALNNYVSTNTTQTITGSKTFTEGIVINKTPVPLTLKATDNNKTYIVYKDSSNNSNFSLGSNSGQTSLEVNRGDLLIQTQQNNKTVSIETGRVKLNRSILECGTEINAGYGGGAVKFIPEDNSTKTLQFYNSAATDNRRFNLLVPEPTAAQNPATKNYVDTKETAINNQITAINNRIVENNTILKRVYTFTPLNSAPTQEGQIYKYLLVINDLRNAEVLGICPNFNLQTNQATQTPLGAYWEVSYTKSTASLLIQLTGDKDLYNNSNSGGNNFNINFSNFSITVFYMNNSNREIEQTYQGQVLSLEEAFGGN